MPAAGLAIASLGLTAVGTGVSVFSMMQSADMAEQRGEQNQKIAHYRGVTQQTDSNARASVNLANAKQAQDEAQLKAKLAENKGKADGAKILSAIAKNTGNTDSVSNSDLLFSAALDSNINENIALYEGAKAAESNLFQRTNNLRFGELSRTQGEIDGLVAYNQGQSRAYSHTLNAFSAGLQGTAGFLGDYAGYKADDILP